MAISIPYQIILYSNSKTITFAKAYASFQLWDPMPKTLKERINRLISSVRKASRTFNRIDKIQKDIKFTMYDIKPTRREHIPKAVRDAVLKRDNYRCVKCGSTQNLEIDHKVSLADGGTNHIDNLQTLCQDCNRRKGVS